MTRQDALDTAIANICQGPIDDYARGFIERPELQKRIRTRLPQITALVAELLRGPVVANCACGAEATTVVGGRQYCAACAARAPRLQAPVFPR